MYFRDTIVAGKTIIRNVRASSRISSEKRQRTPKKNPTSEAVMKNNFRNAVKILTAKLNHNFKPGDYHLTLTYKEAKTSDECKKIFDRFIANMRNYCKKNNIEFKWVAVTEYKHTRIHHHVVISKIDMEVIHKYWKEGYEKVVFLDDTGNYYKLAEYLLKETEKTFREDGSPIKRRYSSSRNVIMPEVKRERISARELNDKIRIPKGYYLDENTKRKYDHAVLGVECMEYILVSLDEKPRFKKWPKGKVVSPRESFKDYERQLSMFDEFSEIIF